MKKLTLLTAFFVLICSTSVFAGWFSSRPQSEMVTKVVIDIPETSKDVIFDKSRMWFANTFKSAQNVIQYESKESGTIIGKANVTAYKQLAPLTVNFKITTESKENKARITIDDIVISYQYSKDRGVFGSEWEDNFKPKIDSIVSDYKAFLLTSASPKKDDNW